MQGRLKDNHGNADPDEGLNVHGSCRVHMHAVGSYLHAPLDRPYKFNIFLMVLLDIFHGED